VLSGLKGMLVVPSFKTDFVSPVTLFNNLYIYNSAEKPRIADVDPFAAELPPYPTVIPLATV